jgi:hypothetical protein
MRGGYVRASQTLEAHPVLSGFLRFVRVSGKATKKRTTTKK